MTTRIGRLWPIGGMPADREAGQLVGLAGGRPADVRLAGHRRQPGQVDPVRAGHEAEDRLERSPSSAGATKTSDLTIWPISAPTAAAASSAVWVDSSKTRMSRSTPFRAAASRTRWIAGVFDGLGHGRESTSAGRVASRAMKAILFDWDGTLADTLGAIYQANVEVMAALGLPFDPAVYRRHFAPDWRRDVRAPGRPGGPARGGERALVGGPRRGRHGPLPGRRARRSSGSPPPATRSGS